MFEGALSPMHWLIVLLIALLIFGPRKLPELGKGLGSALRNFRDGLRGLQEPDTKTGDAPAGDTPRPKD